MNYIQNPDTIWGVPRGEAQATIREVIETYAMAFANAEDRQGRKDVAESALRFIASVFARHPKLSGPCVDALMIFTEGCGHRPLVDMVRYAREMRDDPAIGGFLRYLKANVCIAPSDEQREFIQESISLACAWGGLSAAETRKRIDRYTAHR